MKRSSEKNRFYRSAAAAAVIAALAWASSPVWADTGTVSMTEVTSSVPGAVEDTPAAPGRAFDLGFRNPGRDRVRERSHADCHFIGKACGLSRF